MQERHYKKCCVVLQKRGVPVSSPRGIHDYRAEDHLIYLTQRRLIGMNGY